jgi:hypothetical protein
MAELTSLTSLGYPAAALSLAGKFAVSLSVAIAGLQPALDRRNAALLGIEFGGHPRRPSEVDYRIRCGAGPDGYFFPIDSRLTTIGLLHLATEARVVRHRVSFRGDDALIDFSRAIAGESRTWVRMRGPARWEALVLDKRHNRVVAEVGLRELSAGGGRASRKLGESTMEIQGRAA